MEISQDTVTLIESLYEQLRSYEKVAGLLQLTPATVKKVIMKLQSKKSISQYNNKITDSEKFQIEAAFRYLQDTGERVTLNKIRQHSNLMHKSVGSIWDIMKSMNLGYPLKAKKETVQVRQMRQILSASPKEPQVKKEKDILNMSVDEVIENILEKDEILVKRQDIFRENVSFISNYHYFYILTFNNQLDSFIFSTRFHNIYANLHTGNRWQIFHAARSRMYVEGLGT